jgi:hypothetical protein
MHTYIGEGDDRAIAMEDVSDGAALLRDLTLDDAALLKVSSICRGLVSSICRGLVLRKDLTQDDAALLKVQP